MQSNRPQERFGRRFSRLSVTVVARRNIGQCLLYVLQLWCPRPLRQNSTLTCSVQSQPLCYQHKEQTKFSTFHVDLKHNTTKLAVAKLLRISLSSNFEIDSFLVIRLLVGE
jgi:hypothetical protein